MKMLVYDGCGGVLSLGVAICRFSSNASLLLSTCMLTDISKGSGSNCVNTCISKDYNRIERYKLGTVSLWSPTEATCWTSAGAKSRLLR